VLERRRKIKPHQPHTISFQPFLGVILVSLSFFLHLTAGVSGLTPWYGVALLMLWSLFLLSLCVVWWTPYPSRLPYVGVVALASYFVVVIGGAFAFGWGT
jgi:hypothetical protein